MSNHVNISLILELTSRASICLYDICKLSSACFNLAWFCAWYPAFSASLSYELYICFMLSLSYNNVTGQGGENKNQIWVFTNYKVKNFSANNSNVHLHTIFCIIYFTGKTNFVLLMSFMGFLFVFVCFLLVWLFVCLYFLFFFFVILEELWGITLCY